MKVLVTGHTGFIGSNLLEFLRRAHEDLLVCSRSTGCDLGQRDVAQKAVDKAELVIHLAADARPAESLNTPWDTFLTNSQLTTNVALACRDLHVPLVHVSSCEVYGDFGGVITEDTRFAPTNPYAASKAAIDRLLYAFYKSYGLDVKIVRAFNPYGPHQQLNKILPTFFRQAKEGRPLTVYGDGQDTRDYVYIEDIVRGIWEARTLPAGEAVNLATGVATTNKHLAEMVLRKLGSHSEILFTQYPKPFGGIRFQVGSFAKAQELISWKPSTSLEDGIEQTFEWLEAIA